MTLYFNLSEESESPFAFLEKKMERLYSRRDLARFAALALAVSAVPAAQARGRSIIIYYTRTGTNEGIARALQGLVGNAPLLRLEERDRYARDYDAMTEIARAEVEAWKRRELKTAIPDLSGYRNVFILSPLWWGHYSVPMRTFLMDHPLEGKRVFPVATSASSPASGITSDLAKLLPKADVKKVLLIHTADASNPEAALKGWLSREGFNK